MKKKYTVNRTGGLLLVLLAVIVMAPGCTQRDNRTADPLAQAQQTDSSNRQELDDSGTHRRHSSGSSTVADGSVTNRLAPVNERVIATLPTIRAEEGTRIFSEVVTGSVTYDTRKQASLASRVAGRIERLNIGYNYQPVKKGQLIMEVYAPDLVAAQRELLLVAQGKADPKMLQRARQKLTLLGMQASQIDQVLRSGQIAYRVPVYSSRSGYILEKSTNSEPGAPLILRVGDYVSAGQPLFTIYGSEDMVAEFAFPVTMATTLQTGQKLVFHKTDHPGTTYTGAIGLIQPVFRDGTNFTLARVYVHQKGFRAGELLTAVLPVSRKGWWLPQRAMVELGQSAVIFKKENGDFVPRTVTASAKMENMVLIEENLHGWEIASNAAYLVDSESFIKPAPEQ